MVLRRIATMALIAVAIVGLLLTLTTVGVLGIPRGSGRVRAVNVGVYLDSGCTVSCTSVNWGNINPGSAAAKTIYVKNLGSAQVVLQMLTSNWSPKAARLLVTLSWDLDNCLLSAGEVVPATLNLALASSTSGLRDFSFVIVITGTQQNS